MRPRGRGQANGSPRLNSFLWSLENSDTSVGVVNSMVFKVQRMAICLENPSSRGVVVGRLTVEDSIGLRVQSCESRCRRGRDRAYGSSRFDGVPPVLRSD